MSYKKISDRTSWNYETLNHGRTKAFKLSIRGKTLCLSLALDPKQFEKSKFKVEKDDSAKYDDTPCLYRIKNDLRAKYALELIETLAKKLDLVKKKKEVEELDPIATLSMNQLIAQGLVIDLRNGM